MRIYISGAMTSDPHYEEKFFAAEEWIHKKYGNAENRESREAFAGTGVEQGCEA